MTISEDSQIEILSASRSGDLEELKTLVEALTDPKDLLEVSNEYSKASPLHYASANGHEECVEYLLEYVSKYASTNSNEDLLKEFVEKKNDSGNTALHWAALNGELAVVKLLIEKGNASPFVKNDSGHDPYYEAESNGQEDVVDYFLDRFDLGEQLEDEEEKEESNQDKTEHAEESSNSSEPLQSSSGGEQTAK